MKKLLLVEDNELLLKAIEFKLKKEGFEVHTVKNGFEAMEYCRQQLPDLIVTDLMMPLINGGELVAFVRNELKSDIPIIVLSSVGVEKTVLNTFRMGADDFITKPFSPNELHIRIQKLLMRR